MNRIWIYQSKRPLTATDQMLIGADLNAFVNHWAAHSKKLDARFEILHNRFIVLTVNQEEIMASGCSIDDSVRFMQDIDMRYNLDAFDRMQMAYEKESGSIDVVSVQEIPKFINEGKIKDSTPIFNNLIQDESELEKGWKIPFKDSGFVAFA